MTHDKILAANIAEIIPKDGLETKLKKKSPLIIKLGFDPTSPDLHLGHAVVLRKLREFQNAGHVAVVIVGGLTASIGDPTGQNKLRPPLSEEQIRENSATYVDQLSILLDIGKTIVRNNKEWLDGLDIKDLIGLLSQITVSQMLQRSDFSARFHSEKEIRLHEFLYPLLQGLDSVEIEADIEIGGTDQLFNTMVGRQLQQSKGLEGQILLAMPLLRGIDGHEKMSKSKNNYIGLKENPTDMYSKLMSLPDSLIEEYINLASLFSTEEKVTLLKKIGNDPMGVKKKLAFNVTQAYHSHTCAKEAETYFERNVQKLGEIEYEEIPAIALDINLGNELELFDVCKEIKKFKGEAISNSQIRRLITAAAVNVNHVAVTDPYQSVVAKDGVITIKIGKRGFYKIV